MNPPPHEHQWQIYDVYWIGTPCYGNQRCECGARRKGVALTDDEVKAYAHKARLCRSFRILTVE
jgi:hypothetical protein